MCGKDETKAELLRARWEMQRMYQDERARRIAAEEKLLAANIRECQDARLRWSWRRLIGWAEPGWYWRLAGTLSALSCLAFAVLRASGGSWEWAAVDAAAAITVWRVTR